MIIKDDVRYLLFSEIYSKFSEPKTQRKAFALLESAISTFDRKGFRDVTLTMIARESGSTRQLLSHYFDGLEEIRELALKYIRVIGQRIVISAIPADSPPDKMLKGYLDAHYFWAMNYKSHLRVWLGFLNSSARSKGDREMNVTAVTAGRNRLEELIRGGVVSGVFKNVDPQNAARLIQTTLLGYLVATLTEEDTAESGKAFAEMITRECMRLAGA
jgi:AcrR family transcriptional regulator